MGCALCFWLKKNRFIRVFWLMMLTTPHWVRCVHRTIVHSLVKDVFFFVVVYLPLFSVKLSSPQLKCSTWYTAYINILFCDNSGVAGVDTPLVLIDSNW